MKYQLLFFEEGYQPALYELDQARDAAALLGSFEARDPFMTLNTGDFIDPKEWPYDLAVYFQVVKVEHRISATVHRVNVFVRNVRRSVE